MANADEKVLRIVKAVFESYEADENESDFYDVLPAEIQDLLMESREDIQKGNFMTYEQVMSDVYKRFNISR